MLIKICPDQLNFLFNNVDFITLQNIIDIYAQIEKNIYDEANPDKVQERDEERIKYDELAQQAHVKYSDRLTQNMINVIKANNKNGND